MNTKHFPERIRSACDRLRRRRELRSRGKYLSPERVVWVIVFYWYTTLVSTDELWRRAKKERISISRQTTLRFPGEMVSSGLALESQGQYGGRGTRERIIMTIELQIRSEIYRAFKRLGADRELLGTIGSWGDTLDDKEVLKLLKEWNMDKAKQAAVEALCKRIAPLSDNRPFLVSRK